MLGVTWQELGEAGRPEPGRLPRVLQDLDLARRELDRQEIVRVGVDRLASAGRELHADHAHVGIVDGVVRVIPGGASAGGEAGAGARAGLSAIVIRLNGAVPAFATA